MKNIFSVLIVGVIAFMYVNPKKAKEILKSFGVSNVDWLYKDTAEDITEQEQATAPPQPKKLTWTSAGCYQCSWTNDCEIEGFMFKITGITSPTEIIYDVISIEILRQLSTSTYLKFAVKDLDKGTVISFYQDLGFEIEQIWEAPIFDNCNE